MRSFEWYLSAWNGRASFLEGMANFLGRMANFIVTIKLARPRSLDPGNRFSGVPQMGCISKSSQFRLLDNQPRLELISRYLVPETRYISISIKESSMTTMDTGKCGASDGTHAFTGTWNPAYAFEPESSSSEESEDERKGTFAYRKIAFANIRDGHLELWLHIWLFLMLTKSQDKN